MKLVTSRFFLYFVQAVSNFWEEEREWLGLQVLYSSQHKSNAVFHLLTLLKRLGSGNSGAEVAIFVLHDESTLQMKGR
jgi:hypothetical protein